MPPRRNGRKQLATKAARKTMPVRAFIVGGGGGGGEKKCGKCGSSEHVRSTKNQCPMHPLHPLFVAKSKANKSSESKKKRKSKAGPTKTKAKKRKKAVEICSKCHTKYTASDNYDGACVYCDDNHLGTLEVNWEHDFWYDWNEACGPPDSKYCRERYGEDGGYVWTGCGCTCGDNGECERVGRHEPSALKK